MKFNREELLKQLIHGVLQVTFTKADGSTRVMDATLAPYLLPEATQRSNHTDETLIVYDLDAEGWRSFRLDRLTGVEILA